MISHYAVLDAQCLASKCFSHFTTRFECKHDILVFTSQHTSTMASTQNYFGSSSVMFSHKRTQLSILSFTKKHAYLLHAMFKQSKSAIQNMIMQQRAIYRLSIEMSFNSEMFFKFQE